MVIISELLKKGIKVKVYDPLYHAQSERLQSAYSTEESLKMVEWASSAYNAVKDSACVVILTEWNEFRALDLKRVQNLMENDLKPLFMDFRNVYKQSEMGMFDYHSLGRPSVKERAKRVTSSRCRFQTGNFLMTSS